MKKVLLIIGLGIIAYSTFGQKNDSLVYSFSVRQAIDYAMENQYSVKNAVVDEEIAKERVYETMGIGLPQISSSFDTKNFYIIPTTVIPNSVFAPGEAGVSPVKLGVRFQSTAGFNASQLLFSGDYLVGLQASKVFVELSTKSIQRTKIETAAAVSKAYYTVLINEERYKLTDANITRVKTAMEATEGMFHYGFAEKVDYDRLTVTYNNLLVEKQRIERLLMVSIYLLKYQMGMTINASLTLTEKLDDVKFDINANISAEKFDYSKRVEYNMVETQFVLAKLDLKRNRFSYLPVASAYSTLSESALRLQNNFYEPKQPWYPTSIFGATVTMPILTGGQRYARTQQAKLSLQKAENNIESTKKTIDLERASSTAMLQNAAITLENQKKNIALAEDVYRVSKLKYEQGVGTNLELVTSETALMESQTNYYNALYDAIVAKIDFDRANGNLK